MCLWAWRKRIKSAIRGKTVLLKTTFDANIARDYPVYDGRHDPTEFLNKLIKLCFFTCPQANVEILGRLLIHPYHHQRSSGTGCTGKSAIHKTRCSQLTEFMYENAKWI